MQYSVIYILQFNTFAGNIFVVDYHGPEICIKITCFDRYFLINRQAKARNAF